MNSNPMGIYISRLAEAARMACVENNLMQSNQCVLDENTVRAIVSFFDGKLEQVEDIVHSKTSGNIKCNSSMVKDTESSFTIKYVTYSSFDIMHELGHVFLDFNKMQVGEERLTGDSDGGLGELGASRFARAFLMPMQLFQEKVVDCSTKGVCDIDCMAQTFDVDVTQVICRGREVYSWE